MKIRLLTILLVLLLSACAPTPIAPTPSSQVQHIVLCWLKEPGNVEHRQAIITTTQQFNSIPGVRSIRVGEVVASDREIVDDSFDVGIILTFDSVESMREYLIHPEHVRAVKTQLMPLVGRIQVYDFVER